MVDENALAKAGVIDKAQPHSRVAEELRIVESKLLRQAFNEDSPSLRKVRSNLILVTSALAGEGKSFVSLNVAVGLASQSGRRVILVDADAKPSGLRQTFDHPTAPGLLELVCQNGLNIDNLLVPTAINSLDMLPLGDEAKRSAELFASARMVEVLQEMSRRYADRVILLDAPPCLSSSVPHAVAQVVGQVLFVVAAGGTQQEDIEAALGLVQACPQISLVLNKVPPWNSHSFGLYHYPLGQA
jgi:exopolysaccharide/PEP-CTERM locus tyrosine autokinase